MHQTPSQNQVWLTQRYVREQWRNAGAVKCTTQHVTVTRHWHLALIIPSISNLQPITIHNHSVHPCTPISLIISSRTKWNKCLMFVRQQQTVSSIDCVSVVMTVAVAVRGARWAAQTQCLPAEQQPALALAMVSATQHAIRLHSACFRALRFVFA